MTKPWIFVGSTNHNMDRFIGAECDVITPHRKDDGHVVLYAVKHGGDAIKDWMFCTSSLRSIWRDQDFATGVITLTAATRNSVYTFTKQCERQ